jgi:hypothetical protein
MHATLMSRLNSWTGFTKASFEEGKRTCELFSVCRLNPSGTVGVGWSTMLLSALVKKGRKSCRRLRGLPAKSSVVKGASYKYRGATFSVGNPQMVMELEYNDVSLFL